MTPPLPLRKISQVYLTTEFKNKFSQVCSLLTHFASTPKSKWRILPNMAAFLDAKRAAVSGHRMSKVMCIAGANEIEGIRDAVRGHLGAEHREKSAQDE